MFLINLNLSQRTTKLTIRLVGPLQPTGYPKRDKREPLPYWNDAQADTSLCWSHRSYCRFFRELAHFKLLSPDRSQFYMTLYRWSIIKTKENFVQQINNFVDLNGPRAVLPGHWLSTDTFYGVQRFC